MCDTLTIPRRVRIRINLPDRWDAPIALDSEASRAPLDGRHARDCELVRRIQAGSIEAWHEFVEAYSNLIYRVVRRHLFASDEDDRRSVFVDVLERLYEGALGSYGGRSSLGTWLIVFSRNQSLDFFRQRHGRTRLPAGFQRLSAFDKETFKLFFVDRLPIEIVAQMLEWAGHPTGPSDIAASVKRIEDAVDSRSLQRLDDEHRARSNGAGNARMMRCLLELRLEYEARATAERPDERFVEREAEAQTKKLRELIEALPDDERRVIDLRFRRGRTAREIADELDLRGRRRAYTIIARAVRHLRAGLAADKDR